METLCQRMINSTGRGKRRCEDESSGTRREDGEDEEPADALV